MPSLLPEDGATFHARIQKLDDGLVRATCHAELDLKSNLLSESPAYHVCDSRADARFWVHRTAASRGFKTILWDQDD